MFELWKFFFRVLLMLGIVLAARGAGLSLRDRQYALTWVYAVMIGMFVTAQWVL